MTVADLLQNAAGNLWRMKLRALLTVSGVVIAIAAFVSMLSFGAGMQETISERFEQLGLFTTMYVYSAKKGGDSSGDRKRHDNQDSTSTDTSRADSSGADTAVTDSSLADTLVTPTLLLDSAAVELLAKIPGVNLAYPHENLSVTVALGDTTFRSTARAVPVSAFKTRMFSLIKAGKTFESDTAHSALVTESFALEAGVKLDSVAALIGQSVIVTVEVISLDSAISRALFDKDLDSLKEHFKDLRFDSLLNSEYRSQLFSRELGGALERFLDGYLNSRATVAETLSIAGVIDGGRSGNLVRPVVLPLSVGRRLSEAGFSGSQQDLFTSIASGRLPGMKTSGVTSKEYSRVTLDLDQATPYESIKDSIEALGFETFSFAQEFTEIQKVFLFFNMALGMIGLIALVTAGLGIVNTMVMSILERRREIGVLKSLGADDSDIRLMYLFESGMIGSVGAIGGILVGWLITRGASLVADWYLSSKDIPEMDFFALPLWLVLIAFGIGLSISVIAGLYPASRAAQVDPVHALRND
jgi:putative ABC transport system permease protein